MNQMTSIGIIGGAGWLGRALAGAILDAGLVAPDELTLSYRSRRPGALPDARWTSSNAELVSRSDVVIVSVRPEDFSGIATKAEGKLVVSVMAGISLADLSRHFGTDRVVRILPNAAAELRKSYTPWVGSPQVTADDRAILAEILAACGTSDEVSTETDIDYFTGLTGSGAAYPALLAAAMMKDAEKRGIAPDIARRAVNAVLVGAGRLVEAHDEDPQNVVQAFVDYQGTTAAAINAMRDGGFDAAVSAGLEAAVQKAAGLGR